MHLINSNFNYLSYLPESIKEEIYYYLTTLDVANLSITDKNIKNSIDKSNFWKHHYLIKKTVYIAKKNKLDNMMNFSKDAIPGYVIKQKNDIKDYREEVKNLADQINTLKILKNFFIAFKGNIPVKMEDNIYIFLEDEHG